MIGQEVPSAVRSIHVFAALVFALLFLTLSDLSLTWVILLFMGIGFLAVCFWSGSVKDVLFFWMMLSSSIDINKALIIEGGIYLPGLSITLMDVFFLPLLALWLFEKLVIYRQRIYWSSRHLLVLLFSVWVWFSVIFNEETFSAVLMAIHYTRYFLIFLLIADYIKSPHQLRLALYGLAGAIALHLALVVLQVGTGGAFEIQGTKNATMGTTLVFENAGGLHAFRPSGFIGHPNALADYMVFVLPVLFSLMLMGQKLIGRWRWFMVSVFFVVGLLTLIITLSRGGWISFACAMMFLIATGFLRGIVSGALISRLAMLGLVGIILIVTVFPVVILRITESDNRSTESRLVMAEQALLVIKNNLVFGTGIGGYREAAKRNLPKSFVNLSWAYQEELLKGVVHNKYLLTMAELGIIGFAIFMMMLWSFSVAVFRSRNWTDPVHLALALGVSAGVVGQVAFYIFDHFYSDVRITLLYVFFAMVAALLKLKQQDAAQKIPGMRGEQPALQAGGRP